MHFSPWTFVNWLLAMIILSAAPAFAQGDRDVLSSGELGLAQPLHWGMSAAEAREALPGLNTGVDMSLESDPRLATVGSDPVSYSGCSLEFTLRFFRDRLDQVSVRTPEGQDCHEAIERNLIARYHDPNVPAACPNIIRRHWRQADTAATYDYFCMSSRGTMQIGFLETTDLSGRKAETDRSKNCQLISVELLPAGDADGVSNPALVPDLPDLGCSDYPPISVRLQEQGSVLVSVQVTADGSVANAQLIAASGKVRLDSAAIALAQQKLKFIPAMRDGTPVASVRQTRITYRLLHLIHGSGDVLYRCYNGTTSFALPCDGPFPGITAAPAKGGKKLTVTSRDIKNGAALPADFNWAGSNKSPSLKWTAGPRGTQTYVLIADDPVTSGPRRDPVVSWMVLNIAPSSTSLPRGVPNDLKIVTSPGAMNARGYYGYAGRPIHFQIFALDTKIALDPMTVDRAALIEALKGHVLASGEIVAGEKVQ